MKLTDWLLAGLLGLMLIIGLSTCLGCYSATVTFTGTDEVTFSEISPGGAVVEFKTPILETRSYTKHYLFPPKGFTGDVLDNPDFLRNLLRQTWLMRQPPEDEFTMPKAPEDEGTPT